MLLLAFVMLIVTNAMQAWHLRYLGRGDLRLMPAIRDASRTQPRMACRRSAAGRSRAASCSALVLLLTVLFLVAPLVLIVVVGASQRASACSRAT